MIRPAQVRDIKQICSIYNYYVVNTIVTFEEKTVTEAEMEKRLREIRVKFPWLVYEENNTVAGFAYASPWKSRCAYRFSAESTIYLDPSMTGRRIGKILYEALLEEIAGLNIHSVLGGISLPNDSSVRLHETLGFKNVAHFKEVGFKFNKWIDVGYWELIL